MSRPSSPAVLVIAATDSSGGAGLSRDVETLAAFDVRARCAITAVTVQSDARFFSSYALPPELVSSQIRAALDCGAIGAIKIGMLATAATVRVVAESLPSRQHVPIVLDPVLASSSGGQLLEARGQRLLRELLLPRVTLLTPNIPEAAALLDEPIALSLAARHAQLGRLLAYGSEAVLLKGGHDPERGTKVVDWLGRKGRAIVSLSVSRVRTQQRGTGCSVASAIAALMATGTDLEQACRRAQAFVAKRLARCGAAELPPEETD